MQIKIYFPGNVRGVNVLSGLLQTRDDHFYTVSCHATAKGSLRRLEPRAACYAPSQRIENIWFCDHTLRRSYLRLSEKDPSSEVGGTSQNRLPGNNFISKDSHLLFAKKQPEKRTRPD